MRAHAAPTTKSGIEEMFVQNESVSVCLLLNRRTKTMRVIDFRAGPSHAKRIFVLKLARREGIEKVYTLVERDEVSTWMKLGFAKEANVPCFYKRSDAYLLGIGVDEALATEIFGSLEASSSDDDDDDADVIDDKPSPAHDKMEKTLALAKKQAKALLDRPLPAAKLAQVREAESVQKTLDKALRSGAALTAFEPFGRDVERRYFTLTGRGTASSSSLRSSRSPASATRSSSSSRRRARMQSASRPFRRSARSATSSSPRTA